MTETVPKFTLKALRVNKKKTEQHRKIFIQSPGNGRNNSKNVSEIRKRLRYYVVGKCKKIS